MRLPARSAGRGGSRRGRLPAHGAASVALRRSPSSPPRERLRGRRRRRTGAVDAAGGRWPSALSLRLGVGTNARFHGRLPASDSTRPGLYGGGARRRGSPATGPTPGPSCRDRPAERGRWRLRHAVRARPLHLPGAGADGGGPRGSCVTRGRRCALGLCAWPASTTGGAGARVRDPGAPVRSVSAVAELPAGSSPNHRLVRRRIAG